MDRVERAKGQSVHVRPFAGRDDYERMVDYFLGADHAFLQRMGVDPKKLPQREAWLEATLRDHERAEQDRQRLYLAWIYQGEHVGHSSVNRIKPGAEAYIHLHLWVGGLRGRGLGEQFFRASATEFMRTLRLERIYCEPYAENPAPNRVLLKCGFRFLKMYRTIPGDINFEQDVNQYVLERPADDGR